MDLRDIIEAMKENPALRIRLSPIGWVLGTDPIDAAQQEWLLENGFITSIGFIAGYQSFVLSEFGYRTDFVTYMTS